MHIFVISVACLIFVAYGQVAQSVLFSSDGAASYRPRRFVHDSVIKLGGRYIPHGLNIGLPRELACPLKLFSFLLLGRAAPAFSLAGLIHQPVRLSQFIDTDSAIAKSLSCGQQFPLVLGRVSGRSLMPVAAESADDFDFDFTSEPGTMDGSNKGQKQAQPQTDEERSVVELKPGELGIIADWDLGKVDIVEEGGQAEAKGIRGGWKFLEVDGRPYNIDLLDTYIAGTEPYKVTFAMASEEDGDRQRQTDGQPAKQTDVEYHDDEVPEDSSEIRATKLWLENVVVDLNLCPWTRKVYEADKVRFVQTDAIEDEDLFVVLVEEVQTLDFCYKFDSEVDTTVLVAPNAYADDFYAFYDLIEAAMSFMEDEGLDKKFQIVPFHPLFAFEGEEEDDAANFVNRSPFPAFHILPQKSVTAAVDKQPGLVADLPTRNRDLLRGIGTEKLLSLVEAARDGINSSSVATDANPDESVRTSSESINANTSESGQLDTEGTSAGQSGGATFADLYAKKLPKWLIERAAFLGFTVPTVVQAEALDSVLDGRDAVIEARTGSGKTLAFLLPILAKLEKRPRVQALILLPTRELATQVASVARQLARGSPERLTVMLLLDGSGAKRQQKWLLADPPQVIVGNVQQVDAAFRKKLFSISKLKTLVVDEVDECLAEDDTAALLRRMLGGVLAVNTFATTDDRKWTKENIDNRQTLFVSATVAQRRQFRRQCKDQSWSREEPIVIHSDPKEKLPVQIRHQTALCQRSKWIAALKMLLRRHEPDLTGAIVFMRPDMPISKLAKSLEGVIEDKRPAVLHEDASIFKRTDAVRDVRTKRNRLLLSTPLGARGLDFPHCSHVYFFGVPESAEAYLHAAGRCGRLDRPGLVTVFANPEEEFALKRIANELSFVFHNGKKKDADIYQG